MIRKVCVYSVQIVTFSEYFWPSVEWIHGWRSDIISINRICYCLYIFVWQILSYCNLLLLLFSMTYWIRFVHGITHDCSSFLTTVTSITVWALHFVSIPYMWPFRLCPIFLVWVMQQWIVFLVHQYKAFTRANTKEWDYWVQILNMFLTD